MTDAILSMLNEGVAEVKSLPRVSFQQGLHPSIYRWLEKKHADGEVHEPATIAAFVTARKLSHAARTVFDVGALWGYFALVAQQVFDNPQVTAFEMHPGNIDGLTRNIRPYGKVVAAAVSDVNERKRIWISGFDIYEEPEGGWGSPPSTKHRGRGYANVDFITLDSYCEHTGARPDLIKIDVEAYQANAIRGALRIVSKCRPIVIVELHDAEKTARLGTTNRETVTPLLDLGYKGYWCGNHRSANAAFEPVLDMSDRHERLSLMALIPNGIV